MVRRYMIKSVVMWLHILVVSLLMCVCYAVRECDIHTSTRTLPIYAATSPLI